jgi:predicted nucleotidyltransferase
MLDIRDTDGARMKHHSMADRDHILLERIRHTLHNIEPTARIILYGSRARGDAHPDSDWDLLILLDGPVDPHRTAAMHHQLYQLEVATDTVLSALVLSKEEWDSPLSRAMPFHTNIVREGLEL